MNKRSPRDLDEVAARLEAVEKQLNKIEAAIVVREPATPLAAESFEGLRRQVLAAARASRAHLAQLVEFDTAVRSGARLEDLELLVTRWLVQAGVTRVYEPVTPELFDIYGDAGGTVQVSSPAYVTDAGDGAVQVLQPGIALRQAPTGAVRDDAGVPAHDEPSAVVQPRAPAPHRSSRPVAGDADDLVWSAHRRARATGERVGP